MIVHYPPWYTPLLDRPSNLKEAIDWILRVTRRDGQDKSVSGGNEQQLAKAITELPEFKKAIEAAANKLKESESGINDGSQALEKLQKTDTLKSIIDKLAEGLKAFIGYGGGQGIALVVDPLQQLRKGVLEFMKMMLDKLKSNYAHNEINNTTITSKLSDAAKKVDEKFEEAIEEVSKLVEKSDSLAGVVKKLKDVNHLINKKGVNELASGFKTYLDKVLEAVKGANGIKGKGAEFDTLKSKLDNLLDKFGERSDFSTFKDQVNEAARQLNTARLNHPARTVIEGVTKGIDNMLIPLQKDGYKSSYPLTSTWGTDINSDSTKAAQIFLGCLPLYFYWLTYLYWKCKQPQTEGGWENMAFSGRGGGFALKHFLVGQGYNASHLTTNSRLNGSSIATLLQSLGMTSNASSALPSHTDFLSKLNKKLDEALKASGSLPSTALDDHSLSALFYLCRYYFTGRQIMQSKHPDLKPRPPTSIREMLYWLSGLQFSPHYSDIEKQIHSHIPDEGLHVADSGMSSTATSNGDTLTQSQMKGFLLSSCLSAPGVLGAIQGNSADSTDDKGEPWLYSLFSNSMNLQYPSGPALFNKLSNYAYALQFQLLFLYAQCRSWYSQSYGWQWCRFGQSAHPSRNNSDELASWICKAYNCTLSSCPHNSERCQHIRDCGQKHKSPLQAFLTDNLKGFHVAQQPDPLSTNHLDNHPPGSMCHVPMGFAGALTKDTNATGWYIYYLLDHFCSSPKTSLRQLCEKLSCLTKRTPRTLGDLFGFIWHLNGQLFNNVEILNKLREALNPNPNSVEGFIARLTQLASSLKPSPGDSGIVKALQTMAPVIPFLYQLFTVKPDDFLPVTLFNLAQHCHKVESHSNSFKILHKNPSNSVVTSSHDCSNSPNDLWSLYQPITDPIKNHKECASRNCGGYLYPLTHTFGSAFAPKHASSYLSWVLYLTDDLEIGLQEMIDRFKGLSCTNCDRCVPGSHGSPSCQCPSMVDCAAVLPLFYEYGFTMLYASTLKNTAKRTCQQFHNQLKAVSEGNPLRALLNRIDDFLYMFRFYFFYNLSTFWLCSLAILLYFIFYGIDVLHFKSHVHFPSSHGVPPIGLLTTGRGPALTKLTKLTYFMP
ncbi:variant erythrocyte surface antigen-1 family protein [Babesia caballi]|uniref:Variant erythrocyte surface antigen-1 family protein n=1 Tax=Babesia caballi TaxID=5871 RepID=A0AAV4LVJ3_BABCB|nr:variant erythrocyte surface antigen-1 family protein [Babesia caballi]